MSTNSLKVSHTKLTLAEQVELGRRMTELGDYSARDTLILNCVPVVISAAKGFSKHSQISYDDLFQEGMVGVMEAIDRYDYSRNIKFSSFAYTRIIHRLALWIKKQAGFSTARNNNRQISGIIMDSTIESFHSVFQTYPTDKQLANLLAIPSDDVPYLKKHCSNPVPIQYRVRICDIDKFDASSVDSDVSSVVEKKLCSKYNRKHLFDALETLEPLDREIILGRYLYDEKKATLQEIALAHGICPSTVSRRERHALNAILCYFKDNGIEPDF